MSDLRAKVEKAKAMAKENQERYDKLIQYAQTMSDGYVSSIKVIIDMTALLTQVNQLLEELSQAGIKGESLQRLQNETIANLGNLGATFGKQYDSMMKVITDPDTQAKLASIKQTFEKVQTQPKFSGGAAKYLKKKKVSGRK